MAIKLIIGATWACSSQIIVNRYACKFVEILRSFIRKLNSIIYMSIIAVLGTSGVFSYNANANVYGLKTCGSNSPGFCGSGVIDNSLPPTVLFSFSETGAVVTEVGTVKLNGADIDADALAISSTHGLLGFELQKSGTATIGSSLISIDRNTALATSVGSTLNGRDIRGAVFDASNNLWTLDAASNELLRIDPVTGELTGSPTELSLGGGAFDLSDVSDIAIRSDGAFYVVDLSNIYTLDILTGSLALAFNDSTGSQLAGAAFSASALPDALFTYEVAGLDDIIRYDVDSEFSKTALQTNIIPAFNAGRGDLAAVIPIPAAVWLFGSGLIGLIGIARRKKP